MATIESPRFPEILARGLTVGPSFQTRVVSLADGREQRTALWARARWRADAASAVRTMTDFRTLEQWFYAVGGRRDSFRVRDPGDYSVASTEGRLQPLLSGAAVGSSAAGYGVPAHQLVKRYSAGSLSHDRWTTKPVSGQVTVYRNASPVTAGAGAGQIAVDTTAGTITFVADQSQSISSHTVGASHKFTLSSAFAPNLAVGGRLYVTGVTGTAATLLNSLPLEITNVATAEITVAVATTGLTASGGTAYFYPQPTDALTWAGEFDVHVRFEVDQLDRQMQAAVGASEFAVQAVSIPMLEVR